MVPKVSVIIAIYNAEEYLEECLNSVINQTLREIEVICVNDGSTDNTLCILETYSNLDDRVIILNQQNKGAGVARNYGMSIAKGEYLSFLDADDFFELDMLECAYATAKSCRADVCVFKANLFDNTKKTYEACEFSFKTQYFPIGEPFDPQDINYRDNIFRMYNGWAWDKLFRRKYIEQIGVQYQSLRTTNDMFFVFIAIAKSNKIIALDRVLVHQRVEVLSSLSRTREKSWDCFYCALIAMQNELKWCNLYSTYKKAFVNWALNFSLWQLYTMKGEAQEKVYNLLKREGFARLDVAKCPRSYFFNECEYEDFLDILTIPYEKWK